MLLIHPCYCHVLLGSLSECQQSLTQYGALLQRQGGPLLATALHEREPVECGQHASGDYVDQPEMSGDCVDQSKTSGDSEDQQQASKDGTDQPEAYGDREVQQQACGDGEDQLGTSWDYTDEQHTQSNSQAQQQALMTPAAGTEAQEAAVPDSRDSCVQTKNSLSPRRSFTSFTSRCSGDFAALLAPGHLHSQASLGGDHKLS